jgi:uncharacterized protein
MNNIEERILEFIDNHHILTLAVSRDEKPWCATCFYVYLREQNLFVFTSNPDTKHISDIVETGNFFAAGAVALETKMVGKIQGIQFTGMMRELKEDELAKCRRVYLKHFPVARLADLHLWGLEPDYIKLTDNRLGFGKKIIWTGAEENPG